MKRTSILVQTLQTLMVHENFGLLEFYLSRLALKNGLPASKLMLFIP